MRWLASVQVHLLRNLQHVSWSLVSTTAAGPCQRVGRTGDRSGEAIGPYIDAPVRAFVHAQTGETGAIQK
jgi:hypothetical protein